MKKVEQVNEKHLRMEFAKYGPMWFQRARQKRSSGDASWHCRDDRQRAIGRAIASWGRVK